MANVRKSNVMVVCDIRYIPLFYMSFQHYVISILLIHTSLTVATCLCCVFIVIPGSPKNNLIENSYI